MPQLTISLLLARCTARRPAVLQEEDGATTDLDSQRRGKCVVLKTSTRQTIFLPVIGLVDAADLRPGDLVGVNKDSYLILDKLPSEYDSRVKVNAELGPGIPGLGRRAGSSPCL